MTIDNEPGPLQGETIDWCVTIEINTAASTPVRAAVAQGLVAKAAARLP